MSNVTIPVESEIQVPTGDPSVIRIAQQFLDYARAGKIVAIAAVGVDRDGNVLSSNATPPNPAVLHILIGALQASSYGLFGFIQQMYQKMNTSPILRPNGPIRPQ